MAQLPSLDDRIKNLQVQVGEQMGAPQAPISTDNTNDAPPETLSTEGRPRIRITSPPSEPNLVAGVLRGSPGADVNAGPDQPTPTTTPDVNGQPTPALSGNNPLPSPSPPNDLPNQIDAKIQQTMESLKADGFDGYTPDWSRPQQWTMDDQHKANQAIQDIAAGFNTSLAKTLSLPRETVDRGLGLLGLDYMQHGSPTQHTIDALNNMGIPAYEVDNLANKIGQGALPALATWAAIQLAAPTMAANQGMGAASYLMREVGEWAVKHPVSGLWLGQAQSAGGETATHVVNPKTPLGQFVTEAGGELAGGVAPGFVKGVLTKTPMLGKAVKGSAKLVGMGANALADVLPTDLGNAIKKYNPFYQQAPSVPYKEGLINSNLDANRIQHFAKDQIFAAQTYQDAAIENAINSIPTSGTPAQIQTRTHNLLQDAEKISKRIVSGFWERVPLKKKIGVNDLRRDVIRMRRELVDNDNTRPDEVMNKIITETAPQRNPDGTFKPTQMTVAKMRDYQGQIGTAITEERAKDAPREGFIRNLARLSEMIDDNVALQLPNDTTIEQARQMSKRHNDLFSRGPVNDILSKRRTGDFRVPQADSIDTLMQKTDGLAALKAVQEGVSNYPRIPTNRFRPASYYNNPNAVTPQEKQQLDALVQSASDSIRASFRDAAEQGPQKGVSYAIKNASEIEALGKVAGELAFAAQKVSVALESKKAIDASALARFAETTPEKAVANIFAQRDPADVARQLMVSFRGDPDALEGLRNQIMKHFIYTLGKTNPNVIQKMLTEPRYANLLEATLTQDQFARLGRMVNTAVRVGVEDETGWKSIVGSPIKTGSKIVGAYIGRKIETGTLQAPALISNRLGKWAEAMLGGTLPSDLLAQAVLDPNWEAMLYSRIPTTTRSMREAMVKYRRLFAGLDTAHKQALKRLSTESDNADEQ